MTESDIIASWQRDFPEAAPVGYILRAAYPARWLRIHSLPDSKRLPDSEDDMAELLHRHNTVANDKAWPVLFYSPGLGHAYAPYDGGADLFFHDIASREERSKRFSAWIPPSESGL